MSETIQQTVARLDYERRVRLASSVQTCRVKNRLTGVEETRNIDEVYRYMKGKTNYTNRDYSLVIDGGNPKYPAIQARLQTLGRYDVQGGGRDVFEYHAGVGNLVSVIDPAEYDAFNYGMALRRQLGLDDPGGEPWSVSCSTGFFIITSGVPFYLKLASAQFPSRSMGPSLGWPLGSADTALSTTQIAPLHA